jgi:CheY-like chemotaxis protein
VLSNLLDNAVKFTPPGGRISVGITRSETEAQVAVSDTGTGIEAEDLPRIFDPYRQGGGSPCSGEGGSVGLGLYIARNLIQRQGGELGVKSRPGAGSTFWFTLPLAPAESRLADISAAAGCPLILIVDDDGGFRREVAEVLEETGYRVATAGNCREAWALISRDPPALLLLDIMLPEVDGWQLYAALRGDPRLSSIPTVIVTGLSREQVEPSLLGVQGLLEKPFRRDELLAMARRYAGPSPAGGC